MTISSKRKVAARGRDIRSSHRMRAEELEPQITVQRRRWKAELRRKLPRSSDVARDPSPPIKASISTKGDRQGLGTSVGI